MIEYIIQLSDVIGERAVSVAQGECVREIVAERLNRIREEKLDEKVIVDFSNINSILTVFMNPAIGDLYAGFCADFLKEHLAVRNVPDGYRNTLKRVVDRAKQFYDNPNEFTQSVLEVDS